MAYIDDLCAIEQFYNICEQSSVLLKQKVVYCNCQREHRITSTGAGAVNQT